MHSTIVLTRVVFELSASNATALSPLEDEAAVVSAMDREIDGARAFAEESDMGGHLEERQNLILRLKSAAAGMGREEMQQKSLHFHQTTLLRPCALTHDTFTTGCGARADDLGVGCTYAADEE